jgi:hypothetical protein
VENLVNKKTAGNERFGAMAALARRQFCGNLEVMPPQQVQWKPPLRQAAGTLGDTQAAIVQNEVPYW